MSQALSFQVERARRAQRHERYYSSSNSDGFGVFVFLILVVAAVGIGLTFYFMDVLKDDTYSAVNTEKHEAQFRDAYISTYDDTDSLTNENMAEVIATYLATNAIDPTQTREILAAMEVPQSTDLVYRELGTTYQHSSKNYTPAERELSDARGLHNSKLNKLAFDSDEEVAQKIAEHLNSANLNRDGLRTALSVIWTNQRLALARQPQLARN